MKQTPLEKARQKKEQMREEGITSTKQTNPILKAKENPKSKVMAIKAMCASCMGCTEEQQEPGWREEVRKCSAPHCPLHPHRPFK